MKSFFGEKHSGWSPVPLLLLAASCGAPERGGEASAQAEQPAAVVQFPLSPSANGRHLVDQNGTPFLINQASSWGLIQALPTADATDYLDALAQRGFNTVMVSIVSYDTRMAGGPPKWQAISPFNVQWDFSTPNDAYFAHADDIINRAKARGMLVTLVPVYLGYPGDANQGWWNELLSPNNSTAKCGLYGEYLGTRYKDFANIVWIAGGDYSPAPGSALEQCLKAVVDGIKKNDRHLWTGHWDGVRQGGMMSSENATFASYMNINGYYAYNYDLTYQRDLEFYNKTPVKMLYHLDQSYETEPGGSPDNIRRKAYNAMLAGAAGSSFNAGPSWYLFFDWRQTLDTAGSRETQHWYRLFSSRPWHELVPDQGHTAVTGGHGAWGSVDYVNAARTASGGTLIAYLAANRTVTVNMASISGTQARAWWYNPTNGTASLIGTFPNSGSRNFTAPSSISWALVIDNAALNLPPPGGQANSAAPTVSVAAAANPGVVSGTSTVLSVLGADDGGEANLSYRWAAVGTPAAPVSFSTNASNAAKNTVATFAKTGAYTLSASISDAQGQTAVSSVNVTVTATATSVAVTPAEVIVNAGARQQFSAALADQFGSALGGSTFAWSVSGGGTIDASGLFTAGASGGGPFTVVASAGGKSASARVTVSSVPAPNAAPTVASAALASPALVSGNSTSLSVLGADDGGEANLTYTWATTGTVPAPVAFSVNASNAAKDTVATFTRAGSYGLRATIADALGQTAVSSVTANVNATLTAINVDPSNVTLVPLATRQFSASALDQFSTALAPQPAFSWTVNGAGSITLSGLFTAGQGGNSAVVTAAAGGKSGSASVTISPAEIRIGETNVLSFDDSGNASLLSAQRAWLGQSATLRSLSFYVTQAAGRLRLGIYDARGPGGGPGAKKAETAEITPVVGWNTANVLVPVSLPPGNYWLAFLPSSNNLHFRRASSGSQRYCSYSYRALPATFCTRTTSLTNHWSFYALVQP